MSLKKSIFSFIILSILLVTLLPVIAETADEWVNYGNKLYAQGKYVEAIKYYDAAIGVDAKSVRAWFNKGNALYALKRYQEAIQCYDKVLSIDPNNSNAKAYKEKALQATSASPGNPQTPQNPDPKGGDNLIAAGRVGPYQVGGTTLEQVETALGKPGKIDDNKNASSVVYYYSNMIFYFSSGQVLSSIITTSPAYQTQKGIKVGSKLADTKKLYEGTDVLIKETTQYDYIKKVISNFNGVYISYTGIKFIYDPSYTIVGIEVGQ
jgi:tetratricopeptide (TPR) repeat protein